jgi:hypothetical protein
MWVCRGNAMVFLYTRKVFHNLLLPTAHPTITMPHEGTPQNFALRKVGTKQYVATRNADNIRKSLRNND